MKKNNYLLKLCFTCLTFINFNVHAESFGFMNLEFGGDTLVNVIYTDGTRADISAGQGISFGGGVNLNIIENIEASATFAWKYATVPQASNGDLSFSRFPIEGMVHLNMGEFRVGAGLAYHLGNSLSGSGYAASLSEDFDNALGYVAQLEFNSSAKLRFTARFTSIEYQPSNGGPAADGSSIGVGMSFFE